MSAAASAAAASACTGSELGGFFLFPDGTGGEPCVAMGPGESAAAFGALLPLPPLVSSGLPSPGGGGSGGSCRGRYQLLLSGRALAERYRRIYTAAALSEREQAGHPGR